MSTFVEFVTDASVLSVVGGSWLGVLSRVEQEDMPHYQNFSDYHEDDDEPVPLKQDTLVSYWQNKSLLTKELQKNNSSDATSASQLHTRPHSQQSVPRRLPSVQQSRASTSMGGSRMSNRSTASTTLARQSLEARKSRDGAKVDKEFWGNRLKMLRRELDKAQNRVDKLRSKGNKFEVSLIQNETVAAQLAEERRREAQQRQERSDAIRAHQQAHKKAVRQAQSQIVQDKLERGRLSKIHQKNHQSIVEAMRREEYEEKCRKREKIQQAKVVALLKRVRERAMKDEEIRESYQLRIQHIEEEERDDAQSTVALVSESSKLVEKIRKLRQLEEDASTSSLALRSLDSHLYK